MMASKKTRWIKNDRKVWLFRTINYQLSTNDPCHAVALSVRHGGSVLRRIGRWKFGGSVIRRYLFAHVGRIGSACVAVALAEKEALRIGGCPLSACAS